MAREFEGFRPGQAPYAHARDRAHPKNLPGTSPRGIHPQQAGPSLSTAPSSPIDLSIGTLRRHAHGTHEPRYPSAGSKSSSNGSGPQDRSIAALDAQSPARSFGIASRARYPILESSQPFEPGYFQAGLRGPPRRFPPQESKFRGIGRPPAHISSQYLASRPAAPLNSRHHHPEHRSPTTQGQGFRFPTPASMNSYLDAAPRPPAAYPPSSSQSNGGNDAQSEFAAFLRYPSPFDELARALRETAPVTSTMVNSYPAQVTQPRPRQQPRPRPPPFQQLQSMHQFRQPGGMLPFRAPFPQLPAPVRSPRTTPTRQPRPRQQFRQQAAGHPFPASFPQMPALVLSAPANSPNLPRESLDYVRELQSQAERLMQRRTFPQARPIRSAASRTEVSTLAPSGSSAPKSPPRQNRDSHGAQYLRGEQQPGQQKLWQERQVSVAPGGAQISIRTPVSHALPAPHTSGELDSRGAGQHPAMPQPGRKPPQQTIVVSSAPGGAEIAIVASGSADIPTSSRQVLVISDHDDQPRGGQQPQQTHPNGPIVSRAPGGAQIAPLPSTPIFTPISISKKIPAAQGTEAPPNKEPPKKQRPGREPNDRNPRGGAQVSPMAREPDYKSSSRTSSHSDRVEQPQRTQHTPQRASRNQETVSSTPDDANITSVIPVPTSAPRSAPESNLEMSPHSKSLVEHINGVREPLKEESKPQQASRTIQRKAEERPPEINFENAPMVSRQSWPPLSVAAEVIDVSASSSGESTRLSMCEPQPELEQSKTQPRKHKSAPPEKREREEDDQQSSDQHGNRPKLTRKKSPKGSLLVDLYHELQRRQGAQSQPEEPQREQFQKEDGKSSRNQAKSPKHAEEQFPKSDKEGKSRRREEHPESKTRKREQEHLSPQDLPDAKLQKEKSSRSDQRSLIPPNQEPPRNEVRDERQKRPEKSLGREEGNDSTSSKRPRLNPSKQSPSSPPTTTDGEFPSSSGVGSQSSSSVVIDLTGEKSRKSTGKQRPGSRDRKERSKIPGSPELNGRVSEREAKRHEKADNKNGRIESSGEPRAQPLQESATNGQTRKKDRDRSVPPGSPALGNSERKMGKKKTKKSSNQPATKPKKKEHLKTGWVRPEDRHHEAGTSDGVRNSRFRQIFEATFEVLKDAREASERNNRKENRDRAKSNDDDKPAPDPEKERIYRRERAANIPQFDGNGGLNNFPVDESARIVDWPNETQNQWTEWTADDYMTFKRTYMLHPKRFDKIAAALPGKTPKKCVRFYYFWKHRKTHKKAVKRLNVKIRRRGKSKTLNTRSLKKDLPPATECHMCHGSLQRPSARKGSISITKMNCGSFGASVEQLSQRELRVCSKCRSKCSKKPTTCPMPDCRKRVRRLLSIPDAWEHLVEEDAVEECCEACFAQLQRDNAENWDARELGRLIEAVQRFGTDWASVASFVGTRSMRACVIRNRRNRPFANTIDQDVPREGSGGTDPGARGEEPAFGEYNGRNEVNRASSRVDGRGWRRPGSLIDVASWTERPAELETGADRAWEARGDGDAGVEKKNIERFIQLINQDKRRNHFVFLRGRNDSECGGKYEKAKLCFGGFDSYELNPRGLSFEYCESRDMSGNLSHRTRGKSTRRGIAIEIYLTSEIGAITPEPQLGLLSLGFSASALSKSRTCENRAARRVSPSYCEREEFRCRW